MCVDDYEPSDVWSATVRKARREHRCDECGRTIVPGERYEHVSSLYDGSWSTLKTCPHCLAASQWLRIVCRGYLVGNLHEELLEHWREDELYRSLWLGRAIVGMTRQWRGLGPLPDPRPMLASRGLATSAA